MDNILDTITEMIKEKGMEAFAKYMVEDNFQRIRRKK